MAVVVCTSATGAPGVSTTTLGLALHWPHDVLLADCDRDPAQIVQAGYMRGIDTAHLGLIGLSRAHREGRPLVHDAWTHAVALTAEPSDGQPDRRFLPGFTHPGSAALFQPVWTQLGEAFVELGDGGADVIVDAGRSGRDGLSPGLLAAADVLLVVVASTLRSLAATRLYLPTMREHLAGVSDRAALGLLVVGEGRPYSAAEIEAHFGLQVWATIAYDQTAARVYSDGEPEPRKFADGALPRSFRTATSSITQRLADQAAERAGLRTVSR